MGIWTEASAEAKAAGLKKYDGRTCPKCQTADRYVSTDQCVRCVAATAAARYADRAKVSIPCKQAPFQAAPNAGADRATIRQAAKAVGHTRYDPGEQCVNGHHSPRYVSNGQCVACTSAANAVQRAARKSVVVTVDEALEAEATTTDSKAAATQNLVEMIRQNPTLVERQIADLIQRNPSLGQLSRGELLDMIADGTFKLRPADTTPQQTIPPTSVFEVTDQAKLESAAIFKNCLRETGLADAFSDVEWDQVAGVRTARVADQLVGEPPLHSAVWHLEHGYVQDANGDWVSEMELRVSLAREEAIAAYQAYKLSPEYQARPAAHAQTSRRSHRHQPSLTE
jgi:hypothetical protein